MVKPVAGYRPLAYSSPEPVQTTGTVAGLAAERQVMAATVAPFRGRGEMPRPKVAMRRIKEVLRLKEGLGLSDTAVSRSVRIARSTVKEYLDRAAAVGLNWEAVAELSEEELDRRLFAAVDTRHWDRPLPDWEAVEKELRGRGVTLRLLWLEYLSRHPEGYRYTQFCAHFHAWQRPTLPLSRAPAREAAGNQRPWPADKVERWSIDRLIPYAKNARTHSDAQIAAITASIKEWGWTTPALVGEDGGLIAA